MIKPTTKALIAAGLLSASVAAQAGLSANIGAMSDYWFRGLNVNDGASMMGGIDYEADNGLYVGTWMASTNFEDDDLEYDLYGGYAGEAGDLSYSVGYAGYFYTKSDVDYHEVSLNLGYAFLNLETTFGTTDGLADEQDYTFIGLTAAYEGAYATYGDWSQDADGDYFEVGYETSYEGLDMGVAAIFSDGGASGYTTEGDTVTFYISKTFEF
ncbi:MAG: TorF family putative porin [Neptuniibacter sp.]